MIPNLWNILLKTIYLPGIQEQLSTATKTLAVLERTSEHLEGDEIQKRVHIGRNHSQGARKPNSGKHLPNRGGKQQYEKFKVFLTSFYGNISIPRYVIDYVPGNDNKIADDLTEEMKNLFRDMKKGLNDQIYRDGSGIICELEQKAANNTFVVTMKNNIPMNHLETGMYVDVIEINTTNDKVVEQVVGGAKYHYNANVKITAIDNSAKTVTFDRSFATNTADRKYFVAIVDNTFVDESGYLQSSEIMGFGGIINDTDNFQELSLAKFPSWKAIKFQAEAIAGVRLPDVFHIQALAQTAFKEMTIDNKCFLTTTEGVRSHLLQQLAEHNTTVNTRDLVGGYKTTTFESGEGEIHILIEDAAPRKEMNIWTNETVKLGTPNPKLIDWIKGSSGGDPLIHLQVIGEDSYTATAVCDVQLYTTKRSSGAKYYDIAEKWIF